MARRRNYASTAHQRCLTETEREARQNRQLARSLVAEMGVPAAIDHCLRNGLEQVLSALLGRSGRQAA